MMTGSERKKGNPCNKTWLTMAGNYCLQGRDRYHFATFFFKLQVQEKRWSDPKW
jgi:hypothetical protein